MSINTLGRSICLSATVFMGVAFFGTVSDTALAGNIQPVYSLKNLGLQTDSDGGSFKRTQVKCNTRSAFAYIVNQKGSDDWCIEGDGSKCEETRIDAATVACLTEIIASDVPKKPTPEERQALAERSKLEKELYANEQKRVEIKNRQLELRRKELELIKLRDT